MEKYHRSTKLSTKHSNVDKKSTLEYIVVEGAKLSQKIIDHIWSNGYVSGDKIFDPKNRKYDLPKYLHSKYLSKELFDGCIFSERFISCILGQTLGALNSATEKHNKRIYVLEKNKADGVSKTKLKSLIDKIKKNQPQKPTANHKAIALDTKCYDIEETEGEFFGFIRFTSIFKKDMIPENLHRFTKVPLKSHNHYNKLSSNGKKLGGIFLSKEYIQFNFEFEVEKKVEGRVVGADQGLLDTLTLSDGQVTFRENIFKKTMASIIDEMMKMKPGSKAYKRKKIERENLIREQLNKLDFSDIKQVNLEKLFDMKRYKNNSFHIKHWLYTVIRDKMKALSQEKGFLLVEQSCTYRSQRCNNCGLVLKSNRKGKIYSCKHCGHTDDADMNAAKNHEINLPDVPYNLRKGKLNRKGFFWKENGFFDRLSGRSLESLPPV